MSDTGVKTCSNCGEEKPLSAFQYIASQQRYVNQCKDCINEKRRARARLKGVKPKEQVTDLVNGTKRCSHCREIKPLQEFYFDTATNSYNYLCKKCARAKDKQKRLAKGIMSASERNQKDIERGAKVCNKCGKEKTLDNFNKDNRTGHYRGYCIECEQKYFKEYQKNNKNKIHARYQRYYEENAEALKAYQKEYRKNNPEKKRESDRRYNQANKEKIKAYRTKYYEDKKDYFRQKHHEYYEQHADEIKAYQKTYATENADLVFERRRKYREKNADVIRKRKREYGLKNRHKITEYYLTKRANDPLFKLSTQVRGLIRMSLKGKGYNKNTHTYEILGCDYETLWEHLKATWKKNYGTEWNGEPYHIDHIIPLATAKTEQDVIELCHYTNLQLLKPEDNQSKSDKLEWQISEGDDNG